MTTSETRPVCGPRDLDGDDRWIKPTPEPLGCYDCWLLYDGPGWADFIVPDSVWSVISPTGHEGGVLCAPCMFRRMKSAGITRTVGAFASGPCYDDDALERVRTANAAERAASRGETRRETLTPADALASIADMREEREALCELLGVEPGESIVEAVRDVMDERDDAASLSARAQIAKLTDDRDRWRTADGVAVRERDEARADLARYQRRNAELERRLACIRGVTEGRDGEVA